MEEDGRFVLDTRFSIIGRIQNNDLDAMLWCVGQVFISLETEKN